MPKPRECTVARDHCDVVLRLECIEAALLKVEKIIVGANNQWAKFESGLTEFMPRLG